MQTVQNRPWVRSAPYTQMLRHYERAVLRVQRRREELKAELQSLHKAGTAESANRQRALEKRIELLYEEYIDLIDAIREIRIYAAKEVH